MNCRYPRTKVEQPVDASIRYIPLTQGQSAVVDTKNYDKVSRFKYFAVWCPDTHSYYAARVVNRRQCGLHRDIMNLDIDDPRTVDHAFHDTLDNREFIDGKANLRIANEMEQARNRRMRSSNISGFKGVCLNKRSRQKSWVATIMVDGKNIHLGTRSTAEAAWRELYVPAAIKYHGEFASLI